MRGKKHLDLVEYAPFGQNRRLKPVLEGAEAPVVRSQNGRLKPVLEARARRSSAREDTDAVEVWESD